jgi:hypothetical protein
MRKIWGYVVGAFTLLVGAFLWERDQKQNAEAKLDNANTKKDDAVLEQHTKDLQAEDEKARLQAEADKRDATTQEELLKFLNKDKK